MSDKDNLAETAEYYDTHDIAADMQAGEWSRHEGRHAETAMSGFNTRLPTAVNMAPSGHKPIPAHSRRDGGKQGLYELPRDSSRHRRACT